MRRGVCLGRGECLRFCRHQCALCGLVLHSLLPLATSSQEDRKFLGGGTVFSDFCVSDPLELCQEQTFSVFLLKDLDCFLQESCEPAESKF